MLRLLRWLMVVVLVMTPAGVLLAESVQGLPAPTGYVNDFAGVLTPETKQSLEALCTQVDRQAHAQIAVVTVKTIDPDKAGATPSIEEFAVQLEEKWKVGAKGSDRGVLLVFVMSPIRGRIEVGYGLEGILNDAKVGDIGREMAPFAKQGDYNKAIPLGVREIAQDIATDAGVALSTDEDGPVAHRYHREDAGTYQLSFLQVLIFGGIVVVVIVILISTGHIGMLFWLLMNLLGGSGGGGSDNDRNGGGFGGFGGGSSGGGGASGDF